MRLPRVLADEHGHFAVLEITVDAGAHHFSLDPGFARFLLRQGVRAIFDAEGCNGAEGIGGTKVVALTAAAIVENARAAVLCFDGRKLVRDLSNRGVPINGFVSAIRAPSQGR